MGIGEHRVIIPGNCKVVALGALAESVGSRWGNRGPRGRWVLSAALVVGMSVGDRVGASEVWMIVAGA